MTGFDDSNLGDWAKAGVLSAGIIGLGMAAPIQGSEFHASLDEFDQSLVETAGSVHDAADELSKGFKEADEISEAIEQDGHPGTTGLV